MKLRNRFQILAETNNSTTYKYFLACAHRTTGVICQANSETSEAESAFEEAISSLETIVSESTSSNYRAALAKAYFLKAKFQLSVNDQAERGRSIELAIAQQEQAVELIPQSLLESQTLTKYQEELASL